MPWLKVLTTLRNHPKVEATAKDLRISAVHLRGHLLTLWLGALELAEDGDLSRYDDEMIALFSEYKGDAGHLVQTLTNRGWLKDRIVHDWLDYVGDYLISKYKTHGRDKLVEIWAKHGRIYGGKQRGSKREVKGNHPGSDGEVQDKIRLETTHCADPPSATDAFEAAMSQEYQDICEYWADSRAEVGMETPSRDPEAKEWAQRILSGESTIQEFRRCVDGLMADPVKRLEYSLRGLWNNRNIWINRAPKAHSHMPAGGNLAMMAAATGMDDED